MASTNNLDIYTETEVNYFYSILKNKSTPASLNIADILSKGMRTLRFYMDELLLEKAFIAIQEQYFNPNVTGKENKENCIKLLLRIRNLIEAKNDVKKIISNVTKREKIKN